MVTHLPLGGKYGGCGLLLGETSHKEVYGAALKPSLWLLIALLSVICMENTEVLHLLKCLSFSIRLNFYFEGKLSPPWAALFEVIKAITIGAAPSLQPISRALLASNHSPTCGEIHIFLYYQGLYDGGLTILTFCVPALSLPFDLLISDLFFCLHSLALKVQNNHNCLEFFSMYPIKSYI